jgi:hypothetical protein
VRYAPTTHFHILSKRDAELPTSSGWWKSRFGVVSAGTGGSRCKDETGHGGVEEEHTGDIGPVGGRLGAYDGSYKVGWLSSLIVRSYIQGMLMGCTGWRIKLWILISC